ncbi:tafazzin-like isoform X2 [Ornithodoros turicata]|uniref:tafazzin-like isoform X2 n=1 Tax=Ornithodoros turicata TaxID=34597 RepID=UPI00313862FD
MPLDVQWPLPNLNQPSKLWQLGSSFVVPAVGALAKLFHGWFHTVNVYNKEVLLNAIDNRPKDVPLITVCNHHSCLDDPFLWGMLEWRHIVHQTCMRWSVAAHDICFTNEWHSRFFGMGKTVPVCRGEGVFQRGMDYCVDLLNRGMWVHIFPEGKVNMVTQEFLRLKWGVGRLIAESKMCPIVVPFWHVGMNDVLPNKEPYVPQWGQLVTVMVGKPIDFSHVRLKMNAENKSAMEQRKAFTDTIQEEFVHLKGQAEALHQLSVPSS